MKALESRSSFCHTEGRNKKPVIICVTLKRICNQMPRVKSLTCSEMALFCIFQRLLYIFVRKKHQTCKVTVVVWALKTQTSLPVEWPQCHYCPSWRRWESQTPRRKGRSPEGSTPSRCSGRRRGHNSPNKHLKRKIGDVIAIKSGRHKQESDQTNGESNSDVWTVKILCVNSWNNLYFKFEILIKISGCCWRIKHRKSVCFFIVNFFLEKLPLSTDFAFCGNPVASFGIDLPKFV